MTRALTALLLVAVVGCGSESISGDAGVDASDAADSVELTDALSEDGDPGPEPPSCSTITERRAGDINGDGLSDLVIGNFHFTDNGVYVLLGSDPLPDADAFPSMKISSSEAMQVITCDLDGDCLWDIIYWDCEAYEFHIYLGSSVWDAPSEPREPDVRIITDRMYMSSDIACAGDLDDDGYHDLLLAYSNDVAIIYGSDSISPEFLIEESDVFLGDLTEETPYVFSVAGIGDYDGDGSSDVALHIPGSLENIFILLGWGRRAGEADIHEDSVSISHPITHISVSLNGIGDVNGDGLSDFVMCDRWVRGNCYLFFGRADPYGSPPTGHDVFIPEREGSHDGPIGIGDWNSDGFDDLLLSHGEMIILEGREDWPGEIDVSRIRYTSIPCDIEGCFLGGGMALLEDMNGDGYSDFVGLGSLETEGWLFIFEGRPGGWRPESQDDAAASYIVDRYTQNLALLPPWLMQSH